MACNEQVELKSGTTGAAGATVESILPDATVIPAAPADGGAMVAGQDDITAGGPYQRNVRVDGSGNLIVTSAPPTPGTTVLNPIDTPVAAAAVGVALPAIPAGCLAVTYQNVSTTAAVIRIRATPAMPPPAGAQLGPGQAVTYSISVPTATPPVADGDPLLAGHIAVIFQMP